MSVRINTASILIFGLIFFSVTLNVSATSVITKEATTSQTPAKHEDKPLTIKFKVPQLNTNQAYIEEVYRQPQIDIDKPMSVFRFIFSSLPEMVHVYPTENYYYFSFYYLGVPYAGNLRLAAIDRDKGKVHFAYFHDYRGWFSDNKGEYAVLDGNIGVYVSKTGPLTYSVKFEGRHVQFKLNDLTGIRPHEGLIHPNETYIGPVFDESGVQFFLVYNPKAKLFHYILNETSPHVEHLVPSYVANSILIGNRTGFAFYQDRHHDRKILIGVYNGNANINNYFDGPFDQLPDNFIKGETLKNAIIDAEPGMDGQIDRYGNFADGGHRYMISPYLHYWEHSELLSFHECATKYAKRRNEKYYACFVARENDAVAKE